MTAIIENIDAVIDNFRLGVVDERVVNNNIKMKIPGHTVSSDIRYLQNDTAFRNRIKTIDKY